jgi:two-component system, response regulator PdtaR
MKDMIRILIVEDEVIIAMRFEVFFIRRGYKVIKTVATGEEAVKIATEEKPDVVLMDINLRGLMSGIEAATKIYENLNIPIIFMTGYSDENLREEASKVNPLGYFMKPINMYEVISAINKLEDQE